MHLSSDTVPQQICCGVLTIDLGALVQNFRLVQGRLAPATAGAVVKANAYGLGVLRVAPALEAAGCHDFFVAHLSEALALRPALAASSRVFILNGLMPGAEDLCARAQVIPVVNSRDALERWATAATRRGERLPTVLQFDTGMSRLGMTLDEARALAAEPSNLKDLDILFVMSHLASADEPRNPQNADQLAVMRRIAEVFPGAVVSFANSGGIFLGADYHDALARPGIALYGGAPVPTAANPMSPVVHLDIRVIQTRTVPAGTLIGYGGSAITTASTRLATIAAGYADGLPRSLSNRAAVYCGEARLPMVGRVSMDSIIIDISALPEGALHAGDTVELIGPHQSLEEVAAAAGTISYEILTQLGQRYHRRYI